MKYLNSELGWVVGCGIVLVAVFYCSTIINALQSLTNGLSTIIGL